MRPRNHLPTLLLALLLAALPVAWPMTSPVQAQEVSGTRGLFRPDTGERMTLHSYTLRHRAAADAVPVVEELLSQRGSVTVDEEKNTLVVRDTVAALVRIVPALRRFDNPADRLEFEVMVVRAWRQAAPPRPPGAAEVASRPPAELVAKLRTLLNYGSYELVASADLAGREGEELTYRVGDTYVVGFQVGALSRGDSVKLNNFRLFRNGNQKPMIHTNLILFLDKTYSLGFSKSEESDTALMVVITSRRPPGPLMAPR